MTLLKKTVAACAVALAGLAAVPAGAAVVGTIPGGQVNDVLVANGIAGQVAGWFGADLYLTGDADIEIAYYGAEAGYKNTFSFGGVCTISHNGVNSFAANVGGTSPCGGPFATLAGLLGFQFTVNSGSGPVVGPVNGSNPGNVAGSPNFFVSLSNSENILDLDRNALDGVAGSGQVAWLFLDDAGGPGDDDNHDDMVVRISISNGGFYVPEPTSLALLGAALLGLGAARRPSAAKQ